jgi:hypothetical protein
VKRENFGEARDALYLGRGGGRKSILLDGIRTMSARPSDKHRMRVKTLRWWAACDKGGEILISSVMNVEIIWKVK